MSMQRAVIRGPHEAALESLETPSLGGDDSIVARALASAVSAGTERMWLDGSAPALRSGRRGYPYVPGYSWVGEVIQAGADARAGVGDRIFAMAPHATHAALDGSGYWVPVPADLDPADAAAIALTATGVHAIHRGAPELGATCAVVGLGVVGLLLAQALNAAGCARVIALSASPMKRELAASMAGAVVVDKRADDVGRQLRDLTEGRGADVVFECTGRSEDVELATELVRSKGRIVVTGFHTEPFRVSGEAVFAKELNILGSRASGDHQGGENNRFSRREVVAEAARLISSGQVRAAPLTTHRFVGSDIAEAYRLITGGSGGEYLQILLEWEALSG